MRAKQAQQYQQKLLDLQARLREEIDRLVEAVPEEERPPGEHERTGVPSDEVDKEIAIENVAEDLHRAVAAALEKLAGGTYGRCSKCRAIIAPERLDALPYAEYCSDCAKASRGT